LARRLVHALLGANPEEIGHGTTAEAIVSAVALLLRPV